MQGTPLPWQVIIVVAVVAGVVLTLAVLASASRRDDQDGQSRLPCSGSPAMRSTAVGQARCLGS